jgi:hypothetical protein
MGASVVGRRFSNIPTTPSPVRWQQMKDPDSSGVTDPNDHFLLPLDKSKF